MYLSSSLRVLGGEIHWKPSDIEHMPGFTKIISRYPGPSVLPSEVLHRATYLFQADGPSFPHEDETFSIAQALLDNAQQLAAVGNVQVFAGLLLTGGSFAVSVAHGPSCTSSLRPEKVLCLCCSCLSWKLHCRIWPWLHA